MFRFAKTSQCVNNNSFLYESSFNIDQRNLKGEKDRFLDDVNQYSSTVAVVQLLRLWCTQLIKYYSCKNNAKTCILLLDLNSQIEIAPPAKIEGAAAKLAHLAR